MVLIEGVSVQEVAGVGAVYRLVDELDGEQLAVPGAPVTVRKEHHVIADR